MKKYYVRFMWHLYVCYPAKIDERFFKDVRNDIKNLFTRESWIPQTIGDQVWHVFEFDNLSNRNLFLKIVLGCVPYLAGDSEDNLVFKLDSNRDEVDIQSWMQ